jgi:hypothetical protein
MTKRFNINGICYKEKHYMVNLDSRLAQIKDMVDYGDYFVINRARQFGKTTTLYALEKYLSEEYTVVSLSFQGLGTASFEDEYVFVCEFIKEFVTSLPKDTNFNSVEGQIVIDNFNNMISDANKKIGFADAFRMFSNLCEVVTKPIVLMIDEVDSASNNQVFLDFLGILRDYFLKREKVATFKSVILAGVYDIKNLKQKIRRDEIHKYNSPWNIAVDFDIDMSFSSVDIAGMLEEYEQDYNTGMNITEIADLIHDYTSGYPYMVSYLCKAAHDKEQGKAWTREDILTGVKELLTKRNTLFDDMIKHLNEYPELNQMLQNILFKGQSYMYNAYTQPISIGEMFGFIVNRNGMVTISNRIFETGLYDYFLSDMMISQDKSIISNHDKNQFIKNGLLDMDKVMKKFVEYFSDLYAANDQSFVEEYGRKLFLLYLKPIINGTGNYYIESRTRDMRRTDVIVDYLGKQYIIELKIWRGNEYNSRGENQLKDYLNLYHLQKGWMLSFNFNKNKCPGVYEIKIDNKILVEAVV